MRTIHLVAIGVLLASSLASDLLSQDLTTAELARHLGISSWRIPKNKLPDSYKLKLYHVYNGKLSKEFVIGEFQKGGDLLICTRWLATAVSISADDGDTIISTRTAVSRKPIFTYDNKFEGLGNPLLLCYGDQESANVEERHKEMKSDAHTMSFAKAEYGLAIVITSSK